MRNISDLYRLRTNLILLVCLLFTGCQVVTPTATSSSSEQAALLSINAVILEVYESGSLLVGDVRENPAKIISLTIIVPNKGCQYWMVDGQDIRGAAYTDLAVGQEVLISITEMIDTYPGVGHADSISIQSPGAVESQVPMSERWETYLVAEIIAITPNDEYPLYPLVITLRAVEPAAYAGQEVAMWISAQGLVWRKDGERFELLSLEDLEAGQRVKVLVQGPLYWDPTGTGQIIQELVILP